MEKNKSKAIKRHYQTHTFSTWKCLSAIAFIAGYGFWVSLGFVVIDPCAGTPGLEYTAGLTLAALFPFLLGGLLHLLFRRSPGFRIKSFLKSVAVATIWLLSACVFWLLELKLAYHIIANPDIYVPRWLYEFGCYGDKEPSGLFSFLLYMTAVIITGCLICRIAKRRLSKLKMNGNEQLI